MRIQDYIRALISGWWVIVAVVCIGTGAAFLYSHAQSNTYEARSTYVLESTLSSTDPSDIIRANEIGAAREAFVITYCDILEAQTVKQEASANLGLTNRMTGPYRVNCAVQPSSLVMVLRVQGPSPFLAQDLANEIGRVGEERANALSPVFSIAIVDPAPLNQNPVSPDHLEDIILGAAISLFGGVALVLVQHILRELLKEEDPVGTSPEPLLGK